MNSQKQKIRQITDASVIVALYALFFLISRLTGSQLEYYFFFILPIPVALYAYKYDWKISLIPGVSTLLLSIFLTSNPLNSVIYILPAILMGGIYGGILVKKEVKSFYCVLIMTIFSFASEILSGYVLSKILGVEDIFASINQIIDFLLTNIHLTEMFTSLIKSLLIGAIPSIFIMISLVDALLVYFVFNLIVYRTKMFGFIAKKPSFSTYKVPKFIAFIYIILFVICIIFLPKFNLYEGVYYVLLTIVLNLFLILSIIYLYFGIKALEILLVRKKALWGIVLVYLSLFIFPLILSFVGVVDSFYNLNKIPNQNN